MKEFTIAIEEMAVQEFTVIADNAEDAMELAEKKYKNGEFTLESGEGQFKQIAVIDPCEEMTKWIEF